MSCDRRCEDPTSPQFNLDDCNQCPGADRHPSHGVPVSERPETETPSEPDLANPLDAQGVPVEGAVLRREFIRMRAQIEDMDRRAEIAGAEYLNLNTKCLRLKTALEFYADPKHYDVYGIVHNDADGCSCRMKHHHPDQGLIARTALFMEFGLSRRAKSEFVWIPEAPHSPGLYAAEEGSRYACTLNPTRARAFETREACQTWCEANPSPVFVPQEHGFVSAPVAEG